MGPTQQYFKPFRLLEEYTTTTGSTFQIYSNQTVSLTPAMFGLSNFSNGTYYFEFRAVSKLAIVPICATIVVSGIEPPPTPTPTPTSTSTPTPTPTYTPTPTPTVGDYYYYVIKKYDCNDDCAYVSPDLVGRSTVPLSTIDGMYRKIGSYVYQVQTLITPDPMSFDIDLDAATNTDLVCATACSDAPAYDIYLADEYACTFPGCALQRIDVEVALPAGTTPNYGKFYPDDSLTGFAYLLHTAAGTGPAIILNLANFTTCNAACIV
jgi:hypothetical protein